MESISVTVQQQIPLQRISDLLVSAFEGGSNYWYLILGFVKPTDLRFGTGEYRHCEYPLNPGGAVIVGDREEWYPFLARQEQFKGLKGRTDVDLSPSEPEPQKYYLDMNSIQLGLEIMSKKYPKHYADFISERDDADTGDVFLQCCLFGELVFG